MTKKTVSAKPTLKSRIEALLANGTRPEVLASQIGISMATLYRWRAAEPKRPSRLALDRLEKIEKIVRATGSDSAR